MSNDVIIMLVLFAAMMVVITIAVIVSEQRNRELIEIEGVVSPMGAPVKTVSPKSASANATRAALSSQPVPAGASDSAMKGTPLPLETENELPETGLHFTAILAWVVSVAAVGMGGTVFYRKVIRKPKSHKEEPETSKRRAGMETPPRAEVVVYAPPGSLAARHLARRKIPVAQSKRQLFLLRLKKMWQGLARKIR